MAQHIPIEKFTQKVFKRIEDKIKADFNNNPHYNYLKGSLKYIFDPSLSDFYREHDQQEVFLVDRYIGKGGVNEKILTKKTKTEMLFGLTVTQSRLEKV